MAFDQFSLFSCVAQNGKGTVERKQTIVKVEAPAIEKTNLIGDPSSGRLFGRKYRLTGRQNRDRQVEIKTDR